MAEPLKHQHERKAWDADTMGYDKHTYHHIDPSTINVLDFATSLRGEESHFGDVRQYNSAYNEKHPENNIDLDWLGREGTIFSTEAKGYEGMWKVVNVPTVRSGSVYCRAMKIESQEDTSEGKEVKEISCMELGCTANEENLYEMVVTKLVKKGSVTRDQRIKLTQKKT